MKKEILPDCRMTSPIGAQSNNLLGNYWIPIYCANCGAEGGKVPEENMTFAFWLCNCCWEKHGAVAGMMAVPDEVFWEEVRNNQKGSKQEG